MNTLDKYPRTPLLVGSRLQPGDSDVSQVPYSAVAGRYIVVEEKMDGANAGVRFDGNAQLWLQSRGHYLAGGGRERHFNLLKSWAAAHIGRLFDILSDRYLMYGEWSTRSTRSFTTGCRITSLSSTYWTRKRACFSPPTPGARCSRGSPVVSVPVLYEGIAPRRVEDLVAMVRPSLAKTAAWRSALRDAAIRENIDPERVVRETESSDLSEGLYIKIEEDRRTVGRLKWVRADFLQIILENDSHWLSRPIVPNQLAPGVDIFSGEVLGWPMRSEIEHV